MYHELGQLSKDRCHKKTLTKCCGTFRSMSGSVAEDTAGNSREGWILKDLVCCIQVFGLILKAMGSQKRSLSDTIRFFSDKNNSGRSVEDEIQGW